MAEQNKDLATSIIAKKIVSFMETDKKKSSENTTGVISIPFDDEEQMYYCARCDEFMQVAGIYAHYTLHQLNVDPTPTTFAVDNSNTINNNNFTHNADPIKEIDRIDMEEMESLFGRGKDSSPVMSLRRKRNSLDNFKDSKERNITNNGGCHIEEIHDVADVKMITYPTKNEIPLEDDDWELQFALRESLQSNEA
jgi:hypothetical protein